MIPQEAWHITLAQLEVQLDRATFDTWLRDCQYLGCGADGIVQIGVKNGYARDMLQRRLYREVRRTLEGVVGHAVELAFVVNKTAQAELEADELPLFQVLHGQARPAAEELPPLHQQIIRPVVTLPDCELNPHFTFERFIPSSAVQMTYQAALAVAERPGQAYNPFFIHGSSGTGKTHLLQAIANTCRARGLRVMYITSEGFTNDLVEAIRTRSQAMFREKYRSVDVLLVDDVQFIAGKEATQEEFFHTFNALHMVHKQIVLASDRPPSELALLEDRLRSRFTSGVVLDLQPPDYETRLAILSMWADERGVTLPPSTASVIAERGRGSIRDLEGQFNQLLVTSQLLHQDLTPEAAEQALHSYRRPRHHSVTLKRVLEMTATYYRVSVSDLTSPKRSGRVTMARQIAMYLARELTFASLPVIGDTFGGRTHSTVHHACSKVEEDLTHDRLLWDDVEAIKLLLLGSE